MRIFLATCLFLVLVLVALGAARDNSTSQPATAPARTLAPWALAGQTKTPDEKTRLKSVKYEIYLRAGLVAYLSQDHDKAVAMFTEGGKFDVSARKKAGAETGMQRMIRIVRGKMKMLTPDELLELVKNERQKTAILLADLYLMAFEPEKAGQLYGRILAGKQPFPKPSAGVEAYLLWRQGQSLQFQDRHDEAIACLKKLYNPKYAKYPWAAEGIFRVGTWRFNKTQDVKEGLEHWRFVFTKFPKHKEAERSLFYYGYFSDNLGDPEQAVKAYTLYLKRYPNSRWTKRIENELLPKVRKKRKEKK